ncbi:MAG: tetratricopeptide repeat protein [Cyanobacteria bacterium SIG32]|nr:tetratricopeptide repeat protein [Cyanobacteria bacterium SIG32]
MTEYKTYLDKGIVELRTGDLNIALDNINRSIELKNDWEISYFYRAVVHQAMKNYDEAILDYTKTIQLNDKMTDAYYNRAEIILSRKDIPNPDIERAISDLEKAVELDPKFIDALFATAAAYKKLGDYHKALEYLEKLLQIEPDAVVAKALKKLILQKYIV